MAYKSVKTGGNGLFFLDCIDDYVEQDSLFV